MRLFRFIAFFLFLSVLFSCGDNGIDPPTPKPNPNPNPNPTTDFETPANKDIVMYEANIRAFSSTGNFQDVINKLDHFKSLGVNVIWLMPIYPIGTINTVNSPYSVKNYKEVNPEFGDLEDLQNLVSKAHEKDMAVILDWVANHTAWDNPWIENKDWYTQDGNGNIVIPPGTNWQDVADLNFDNAEMRLAMIDAMEFWLDTAYVDGFRCDAADMVPYSFWKQAIDSLNNHSEKNLIMLAEGARDDHFDAGFDLNFGWDYYGKIKNTFSGSLSPASLLSSVQSEFNNTPSGKRKLYFTTNHDESAWDATPVGIFGGIDGALAASVISIFVPGVPLIYSSQEVGREDNLEFFINDPINWSQNSNMLKSYQEILSLYSTIPTMRNGNFTIYNHNTVAAFSLREGNDFYLVLVNVKNSQSVFELPLELQAQSWTDLIFETSNILLNEEVPLGSYRYDILKLEQ
ncbi:MAG TPA: alpha-amylase family glycosyl hydrolase [Bacteroidales bacterium]|nr:alpha-amylase family glycosyl hydrolase [Bacteroidales bacterium]HRX98333.1 alpha-amylase family glycosyl hydrolase [Bacteroidales bacterium]